MKVMDMLGNELREGDVVFFRPINGLVVVGEIEKPSKVIGSKTEKEGRVRLEMFVPFSPEKGQDNVAFGDLMKVFMPDDSESARINEILNRVKNIKAS